MSSDFLADHATQHADVCSVPPRRGHQDDQSPPEETDGDLAALWIDLPGFLDCMGDTFEDLGGVGERDYRVRPRGISQSAIRNPNSAIAGMAGGLGFEPR